jgi:hypothetical protein
VRLASITEGLYYDGAASGFAVKFDIVVNLMSLTVIPNENILLCADSVGVLVHLS